MAGYIDRIAAEIAALIAREGLDDLQTKAVFRAARQKAGLTAPKPKRGAPARLTLEEELRFIDQAYARSGTVGLMMQTLLETGARVSEFVALRIEDVSLAERVVIIVDGKGGKRREVPIRPDLARPARPAHRPAPPRPAGPQPRERQRPAAPRLQPPADRTAGPGGRPRRRHHQADLPPPAAPHHGD